MHRPLRKLLSRRPARAVRVTTAIARTASNDRTAMSGNSGWSVRASAAKETIAAHVANGRAAIEMKGSAARSASNILRSHMDPTAATNSRIPIRPLQSLLRSSSSLSKVPKSRLENRCPRSGSPTHRQMALAHAHGAHPQRCRRADRSGVRAAERQAYDRRQPSGADWRCGHARTRSRGKGDSGGGSLRKARRRSGRTRALPRFDLRFRDRGLHFSRTARLGPRWRACWLRPICPYVTQRLRKAVRSRE